MNLEPVRSQQTHEPLAEAPSKSIALHLVTSQDMRTCPFWIGLFTKGEAQPGQLFDVPGLSDVFEKAATQGVNESEPLMLSDSATSPAKFFYLLPEPGVDNLKRRLWVQKLGESLQAWSTAKVGFYLSPQLVNQEQMRTLIHDALEECILKTNITDYYLQTSTHGLNAILNTALAVRSDLAQQNIAAYVFH